MAKEAGIPKAYIYTVEGVFDENENLRKFSTASISRDLHCEFDLESIASLLQPYSFIWIIQNIKILEKWPLVFKFQTSDAPQKRDESFFFPLFYEYS